MCGNITEWGVDVRPDGGGNQPALGEPYTLDFQVWRPSPTVDDSTGTGCYSLVGNNRFTSIPLSGGVASSLIPSPSNYIKFQPGDVLGVYIEEARGDNDGVVILTSFDGTITFTSELVWYASIAPAMATSQNGDCPYSVGSNGVLNSLTRAAPVISISTVTFPCPPLPSMATAQPTPQPPNPTTDSEETPPTTNQQTQEPIDSLASDSTNGIQATDSEGATGTELRVPTTSETATDLRSQGGPSNVGLIIGIVVIVIVTVSVVMVFIIAIPLKKHHGKSTAITVPTAANQAYGLNTHKGVEESIYNISDPKVDIDNTIEAKQNMAYAMNTDLIVEVNEAYATRIATVGNEAYATSIVTEGNQAYATNITTEGNQAYATCITTEKNAAYEPVTTTGVYEVINQ